MVMAMVMLMMIFMFKHNVATSHLPYKMATATTVDRMTPLSGCCKGVKWSAGHGEGKHGAASMALRQASDVG